MIQTKAKRKDRTTDKVFHKAVATALNNTGNEWGSPLLSVRSVVNKKYCNIVKRVLFTLLTKSNYTCFMAAINRWLFVH